MSYATARDALADRIRYVPDFPAEGVIFEDLTPVLADGEALRVIVDELSQAVKEMGAEMIGGLDARGFLLGSAVAYKLGMGVLAIRKKGKLPPPVFSAEYDLEYGSAALEIPGSGVELQGRKIALVDDVLATGGTLCAARSLLEKAGASVVGNALVLEVGGLGGRQKLADVPLVVLNNGDIA
ncbi:MULTISPECIES: adenine phosphoribosyltransferase [Corynebacterium]|uniref:adenine phosphoribosyltransferase n=1 Tax=Corynebacterium TaxID=1716 RepID=UPI00124BD5BE|nr:MULTISPECIES: adenine phosphoribosyltransferase [Corynebacterium]